MRLTAITTPRHRRPWLGVTLAALLAGCGGFAPGDLLPRFGGGAGASSEAAALWRDDVAVTVRGRLAALPTDTRSCILLRRDSAEPVALIGEIGDLREGAAVEVTGPVATWSTCETFRTIRIDRIARLP